MKKNKLTERIEVRVSPLIKKQIEKYKINKSFVARKAWVKEILICKGKKTQ